MKYGFAKIGAFTPNVQVADVEFNANSVKQGINQAKKNGVELICFPELCLSSCSCQDLFYTDALLSACRNVLRELALYTSDYQGVALVGLPFKHLGKIYNVCAVLSSGKVVAFVPKGDAQTYSDINKGIFNNYVGSQTFVDFFGEKVIFSNKIIFKDSQNEKFTFGVCFGSDITNLTNNVKSLTQNGANILAVLGASPIVVGKESCDKTLASALSKQLNCAICYCESGEGETTSDYVFAGVNGIFELGKKLATSKPFTTGLVSTEIDLDNIDYKRAKRLTDTDSDFAEVIVNANSDKENLSRSFAKLPFLPENGQEITSRANLILDIQSEGLKKRIAHTRANNVVIGLSGGLDSTLAILVCVSAIKKLNRSVKDVVAVTMPCFGTTGRTFKNTVQLAKALGVTLKKVDIAKAVTRHLKDIKHQGNLDVTYENAQARERTQVLMDIANMNNGIVVGTGDLSELALGWATYNGDHMSMYAVNGALPKTLIRYLVNEYAKASKPKLKSVLLDILDTPVSPELLPAKEGKISQKTEDIVGPYELHDFFLYNMIGRGWSPKKIYFVAKQTFNGEYDDGVILKWLKTFTRRFFIQQFKRSCLPDGVKIGSIGLSPRAEWKMPSDAVSAVWLKQLDNL